MENAFLKALLYFPLTYPYCSPPHLWPTAILFFYSLVRQHQGHDTLISCSGQDKKGTRESATRVYPMGVCDGLNLQKKEEKKKQDRN